MNNGLRIKIRKLKEESIKFWKDLHDKYGVYPYTPLKIYSYSDLSYNVRKARKSANATMVTISSATSNRSFAVTDDSIITEVESKTFMSYERLFLLLIECDLDFDKASRCLRFLLRHEFGHVLNKRRYIGKPVKEWVDDKDKCDDIIKSLPKLRRNASNKNKIDWSLLYNNEVPGEKLANVEVGITDDDIIEYNKHILGE